MKIWNAAAYLRLSRDDEDYEDKSQSIKNQEKLILKWIDEHPDVKLIDVFVDDGYTGVNFERPGFERMMTALKFGQIDCVITKDLSRLGRNTSKVIELKDERFPELGVRFIAINDGVDSKGKIDNNDFSDFKILFNEYYCKDISKKIRSSLKASAANGEYVGSFAAYGYKKDKNDKHKLVVDNNVADIVRMIFKSYSQGKTGREIADKLNNENVLTPFAYRMSWLGKECDKEYKWTSSTVYQILRNEVYYGDLVQHKTEVISYKVKGRQKVDEKDIISVAGTHEALVDEKTRILVEKRIADGTERRVRKNNKGECVSTLFSGILVCADCGSKLAGTTKDGSKRVYRCWKYNGSSKACTSHYIRQDYLIKIVKNELLALNVSRFRNPTLFRERIVEFNNKQYDHEHNAVLIKKKELEQRKKEIEDILVNLYEDSLTNTIGKEVFGLLSAKYNDELNFILREMLNYDKILKTLSIQLNQVDNWINALINTKKHSELTIEDITNLIDKIIVYDVSCSRRVKIKYKVGYLEEIISEEAIDFKS